MNCLQVLWVHPDIKSFEHLSNVTIGRIQESSDNDMYEKEGHLHVSRNIQCTFVHPNNERLLRRFHKKIISIFVISTINGKTGNIGEEGVRWVLGGVCRYSSFITLVNI